MSFNIQNISQNNVSTNTAAIANFNYDGTVNGTTDTLATIITAGYFNSLAPTSSSSYYPLLAAGTFRLKINDLIFCTGTDVSGFFQVTAVSPNVVLANVIGSNEVITITGTTTLVAGATGQIVLATGASGYIVTLPAPSTMTNESITIVSLLTAGQVLTVNSTGGANVNVTTTYKMGIYQSAKFLSTGTAWVAIGASSNAAGPYYAQLVPYAGGSAAPTFTVPGAVTGDGVSVTVNSVSNASTFVKAIVSSANTITVTLSADPGASSLTIICYHVPS